MRTKTLAVIGGGVAGATLAWCLTRERAQRERYAVTLLHDEPKLGGHSDTYFVAFDGTGRGRLVEPMTEGAFAIDIGVQFVTPPLYPHLFSLLQLPELREDSRLQLMQHPALKIASSFGEGLSWGNFGPYQHGARFAQCLTPAALREADAFVRHLRIHDLRWRMNETVDDYLRKRGVARDGAFFRYMLLSYLLIINGYGTNDLLRMTKQDLMPIFTSFPPFTGAGPLGSFRAPGRGWYRFRHGAECLVEALGGAARRRGAAIRCNTRALAVAALPQGGVRVVFEEHGERAEQIFDEVVLTTDMDVNARLLAHEDNTAWSAQAAFVGPGRWNLMPGVCLIHQDTDVLSPALRDGREDVHFNAAYAWNGRAGNEFDLPYRLEDTYTTYLMHNIVGTPAPCYVSMYAVDDGARRPRPDSILFEKRWKHGRWVSSHDARAKRSLHTVQGVGNIWFAGNNTTLDSEEGAMLSSIILAERMAGFRYPFGFDLLAQRTYAFFRSMMFPVSRSLVERGQARWSAWRRQA